MNTHANKTQENKNRPVANQFSQNQNGCGHAFQFVDNRPEATAQRKAQEMANNSPQAMQAKAFQRIVNSTTILQLKENDVRFLAANPVRISTSSGYIYLLEGNEKYGDIHAEKHSQEIKNVSARRGWKGSISDILFQAIKSSTYTAYQVKDDRGSTVRIPVTARKMIVLAIANDGKIITAMVQESDTKAIKLFWQNGPSDIIDIGWKIARGEDPRSMSDAPWDLYQ